MITLAETTARDLRPGDGLSLSGASGLDGWYHTADASDRDYTVASVQVTNYGESVSVRLTNGDVIETRPDIQVTVRR